MLLREALSSENTPFTKLLRIAKNIGSSATRPVSLQFNEVDPRKYEMYHLLTPAECADIIEQYEAGVAATELAPVQRPSPNDRSAVEDGRRQTRAADPNAHVQPTCPGTVRAGQLTG